MSVLGESYRRRRIGFALQRNITRSFWVGMVVPSATMPGNYSGSVSIACTGGTTSTTSTGTPNGTGTGTPAAAALLTVGVDVEVWPIAAECLQRQSSRYGKAWGFDHTVVGQLQPNKSNAAAASTHCPLPCFCA